MTITVDFDPPTMYSRKPAKKQEIVEAVQNSDKAPAGAVSATVQATLWSTSLVLTMIQMGIDLRGASMSISEPRLLISIELPICGTWSGSGSYEVFKEFSG
ncbi:hypothetical protein VTL71DRAFT_6886 [Oculimacula yallundae]|uniref:Uncharacterized protein n=1 Tax=Oculimacula yallundae TaxID=86028 RepID=A0ABR4BV55_9HELO